MARVNSPKKRVARRSPKGKAKSQRGTQSPTKKTRAGTRSSSKSPRKGAIQVDVQPSKKPSGPARHCKICENQPLRASFECRHSKLYKDKLRELLKAGIVASESTPPFKLLELWTNLQTSRGHHVSSGTVTQPPFTGTASGGSPPPPGPATILTEHATTSSDGSFLQMHPSGLSLNSFQNNPLNIGEEDVDQQQLGYSHESRFPPGGLAPVTPHRNSDFSFDLGTSPYNSNQVGFQFPTSSHFSFGVTEENEDEDFMAAPTSPLIGPRPVNNNGKDTDIFSSLPPSSSVTPSQTSAASAKQRIRVKPSEGFLPYGTVVGAGKGPAEWEPARTKELPSVIDNAAQSSKRYRNVVKDLVCRCERLGAETGCWLYLAAQHPMAREPFVNFTSRRLVQDYIPMLDDLHNTANKLFASLQSTRRYEAAELAANLKEAQDNAAASQAENNALRADKDQLNMELQYKDELIRKLQQIHGTLLEPST